MSHLEQRMETDLHRIRDWFWQLGEDVEKALRNAKKTLVLRDEELAYATVLGDHPINRNSRRCDRMCHEFSARYLPGAGILREMASTIRANIAIERIGDYAVTICREALLLEEPLSEHMAELVDELADESISILHESRCAFRDGNADQAIAQMQRAKRIKERMDDFYEELFAQDDRLDGRTMMAIFVVMNSFKRVADQAKNVCDQTVFAVRGVAKLPKVYRILFLDREGSDTGQLAAAIGRRDFPDAAEFICGIPGRPQPVSPELNYFLVENALPNEGLESEPLAALQHDLTEFEVIVSVSGQVRDHVPHLPFHTSALNWTLPADAILSEKLRLLRPLVGNLVTLLAGNETDQA
jgi:phosphate transport system protein